MDAASPLPKNRPALAALLEWYAEAGIDTVVAETPRDRFAETQAEQSARAGDRSPARIVSSSDGERDRSHANAASAARQPAPPRAEMQADNYSPSRVAVPDDVAIADARERARSAETLGDLEAALATFESCNLRLTAKSFVFGNGDPSAYLMLIGEAPGRDEDIAGEPFVGKSGQLLDRMLAAIGIERARVRVTNTVPWRPPGNRPPTPAETEMCLPFLARHIELVAPKIIVCLGSPAAKALLQTDEGILKLRGRWQTYSFGVEAHEQIPALPMLHPAYLLRQPAQKKLAWRDLLALKARIEAGA